MFQVNLYGNYFTGTEPRTVAPSRLQYKTLQIFGYPVLPKIRQQPPPCYQDHDLPEAVVYPASVFTSKYIRDLWQDIFRNDPADLPYIHISSEFKGSFKSIRKMQEQF